MDMMPEQEDPGQGEGIENRVVEEATSRRNTLAARKKERELLVRIARMMRRVCTDKDLR